MSYYPELKQRLTCREVAPRYGVRVNAAGMAVCPFHDDNSPSMKLSCGFYCFGCGAQGDVITFVSRLFGISIRDAARKLSADFEIPLDDRHPPNPKTETSKWLSYAKQILHRYYDLLVTWKWELLPQKPGSVWHPLFAEALQKQADIRELLFELEFGTPQEINTVYEHYRKTVIEIDERIHSYDATGYFSATEKERQGQCSANH